MAQLKEPYAFVSYAHEDATVVAKTIALLREAGFAVWYDAAIDIGSSWTEQIADAIANCSAFVVFVSQATIESQFVKREIDFAALNGKAIIAVYMERFESLPPALAFSIGNAQGIIGKKRPNTIAPALIAALKKNGLQPKKPIKQLAKQLAFFSLFILLIGLAYKFLPEKLTQFSGDRYEIKHISKSYFPAQEIAFTIENIPPEKMKDGIIVGVAKQGADDREWVMKDRKKFGSPKKNIVLRAPAIEGEYEIRAYYVKSDQTAPIARRKFSVQGEAFGEAEILIDKRLFSPNEKVYGKIRYSNAKPVSDRLLFGLWKRRAADNQSISTNEFPREKTANAIRIFSFLAPKEGGRYELRVYNNAEILAPTTLMARETIVVRKKDKK